MHVHLEEGPYSLDWLKRTAEAMLSFASPESPGLSRAWLGEVCKMLQQRTESETYSADWLGLYLQRAKQLGLQEVGIVEHLYRFRSYKSYYTQHLHLAEDPLGSLQRQWLDHTCIVPSLDDYVSFILEQKQRWAAEGICLKVGIELDYWPGCETVLSPIVMDYPWDFTMGAVHFLRGWRFAEPVNKSPFREIDITPLYAEMFHLLEQAISSGLFDLIAHPDHLKVLGNRPTETALLPYYQRIARLLRQFDVATEINTRLFYRSALSEMSPSECFLGILAQHQVPITTSSDAHYSDEIGQDLLTARQMLKKVGYRELVSFDRRKRRCMKIEAASTQEHFRSDLCQG